MLAFCEKHEVNLDWLMFGDLKGLQRMTQERRVGKPAFPPGSLQEKLACLTDAERETIRKAIDQFTGDASRSAGADFESATGNGWQHTLGGCGDNNSRGLSSPRLVL
jgi:hypothetical protein